MVVFARSYSKIITVTSVLMSDMLGRTGMSSVGDRMMYMPALRFCPRPLAGSGAESECPDVKNYN